jgi:hypothetical protein
MNRVIRQDFTLVPSGPERGVFIAVSNVVPAM